MFWANVNNEKSEPTPKAFGTCPLCNGKVHSKCGDINEWHWAHYKAENCDSWYEPESYWHLDWKMTFGIECAEQVIKKNGILHRADVLTNKNVIIELQNSPIQKSVISQREEFYGEKMLWVINGIHFKNNFKIYAPDDSYNRWTSKHNQSKSIKGKKAFEWNYARKSWSEVNRHIFIDFGTETLFWVRSGMGTKNGSGFLVSKKDFINKYGGDFEYYQKQFELRRLIEEEKNREIKKKMEEEKHKRIGEGYRMILRSYNRRKRRRW